jgi:colicin import membrane protein
MKNTLTILLAATLLTGTALAQSQAPVHDKASAQAFFRKGDLDHNGKLDAAEARALGISQRQVASYDADGDGRIDKSEFYVAYRKMVRAAGEPVQNDLEDEVARILAERKAIKARKDAKKRSDAEKRTQHGERVKVAEDKANAEKRDKHQKREKVAEDKANAEKRAQHDKRVQAAKDKAAAEARAKAEARRKAAEQKRKEKKPAPAPKKKSRIGG